eukprot:TRINITY_DN66724_c4_g4_i1.p2 TRINITY_DN66724_c4_g4~~TRINITY_DN66724_c4_g4_i1.p2  ORF type:complete len:207 (-),score=84.97 TRINITY_DN66724_c4_g4_i1:499-1119(-)
MDQDDVKIETGRETETETETAQEAGGRKVLLGLTGSVASIKAQPLIRELVKRSHQVRVVATQRALSFVSVKEIEEAGATVYTDELEWSSWKGKGDPVWHIELRKWADVFVVAPLSANTMAKLANGLCDNMLTCVARAWDLEQPFIVAPAMNTLMWDHPLTAKHLAVLTNELNITVVPPVSKTLACGDTGVGAMASVDDIANAVVGE